MEEKVETSKKKKYLLMIIPVVILVIALVGGIYYYKTRPKVILKESYNYLTKGIKNTSTNQKTALQEKIQSNNQVKLESNMQLKLNEDLELGVGTINLNLEAATDKEKEIAHYKIDSKLGNEELFNIETYLKDNKLYMTIKNIMDKYYYIDKEYFSYEPKNEEDINTLMDAIGNAIQKIVTDNKFSKTSEKINVDGDEIEVTKLSLNITDTLLSEVATEFIKQARNNEEVKQAFINLAGVPEAELEETLTQLESEMKDTDNETILNYHIYYTGSYNIKMLELENDGDSLTYTANKDYHIQYKSQNEVILDFKLTNDHELEIKIGTITISGTYQEENQNKEVLLKVKEGTSEIAEVTIKTEEKSDTENAMEMEIKSEGMTLLTITANNKYTFGEEIKIDDLENAKNFDEMTSEEIEEIQRKLEIHPLIGPLFQTFNELFGDDETFEDDDFDFEEDIDPEAENDSGFNYKVEYLH